MSWHPYPFVRLILPLIFGICLGEWTQFNTNLLGVFAILFFLAMLFLDWKKAKFENRTHFGIATFGFLIAFGWQITIIHNEKNKKTHFSNLLTENETHFVVATLDEPVSRTTKKLRTRVKVQAIGTNLDSLKNCTGNLLVYLDTTAENALLNYGDVVILEERIQSVPKPPNPDGFNYQKYLHFQNIHYQAFTFKNVVQKIASDRGNWVWKMAYARRDKFLKIIEQHFPTDDERAVAGALLIGYKNDLSDDIKNAYIETGSMHALAVSGMHVGGLYVALGFFFSRMLPRKSARLWLELVVSIFVIWSFTFITGASASVLRAAVMFTLLVIGRAIRRDSEMYNTLASSAFLILLFNPTMLFDAGFQLSYLAVIGIVFFGEKFLKFYRAPKGFGWAWETIAIGFAAQIATLPVSLYYFHQMPTYFWLSGLLVVPLGMLVLWGGMLLFCMAGWLEPVAALIGKLLFWIVLAMNKGIFLIHKLPASLISGIAVGALAAILLYGVIIFLAAFWRLRQPRMVVACLGCCALLTINYAFERFSAQKRKQITIFSFSGKSLIDFQMGEKLISVADSISEKDLGFATDRSKRIGSTTVFFDSDTSFQTVNLLYDPPFIQFFDKKMVIIDHAHPFKKTNQATPILVDFVLFRQNPMVKIEDVQQQFAGKKFLFDGSNSFSKIKKWSAECVALDVDFQDLRKNGAFRISW